MFHIVIEGFKNDHYYSEKLIDCLITKTVPIYWGHTEIGKYFNEMGMIQVDSASDIISVQPNATRNIKHLISLKFLKK